MRTQVQIPTIIKTAQGYVPSSISVQVCEGIGLHLVGMPSQWLRECLLRVCTALVSKGLHLPAKKIVISLQHTCEGNYASLDLPVALGLLAVMGRFTTRDIDRTAFVGELGLDASLRPVRDMDSMLEVAESNGFDRMVFPLTSDVPVKVTDVRLYPAMTLQDAASLR